MLGAMLTHMNTEYERLLLYYKERLIGTIHSAFLSDGTWFGQFERASIDHVTRDDVRASEFILFCMHWNSLQQSTSPPGAEGFDHFSDVCAQGNWTVVGKSAVLLRVKGAPVFSYDGHMSFIEEPHVGEMALSKSEVIHALLTNRLRRTE